MKNLIILLLILAGFSGYGQTTWYEVNSGTSKKLTAINFPTPQVGYIGGDSILLKTTNGGANWSSVAFTGFSFFPGSSQILNLDFVTADIGFATIGPYSGTYKTINGGITWAPLTFDGTMCYNQGLYMFSENEGFVGGSGCFQGEHIEKMTGGVLASSTINTPAWNASDMITDFDFLNSNYGLATSAGGRILKTTDGGITWDTISATPVPNGVPLTAVHIVNDTLAYAGYDPVGSGFSGFGLLETHDAGNTWDWNMTTATFFYPAFYCLHQSGDGSTFSGAGTGTSFTPGLIFEDFDQGSFMYHTMDQPIFSMDSYNDSIVWAVGDSGYVVVNTPLVGLGTQNYETVKLNIYPNPTADFLQISLVNSQEFCNLLQVMDINGRLIMEIHNPESVVDVTGLTEGIYILNLSTVHNNYVSRFVKN